MMMKQWLFSTGCIVFLFAVMRTLHCNYRLQYYNLLTVEMVLSLCLMHVLVLFICQQTKESFKVCLPFVDIGRGSPQQARRQPNVCQCQARGIHPAHRPLPHGTFHGHRGRHLCHVNSLFLKLYLTLHPKAWKKWSRVLRVMDIYIVEIGNNSCFEQLKVIVLIV